MHVLILLIALVSHQPVDVICWHVALCVVLALMCTVGFHCLAVGLFVGDVLELERGQELEVCLLYLVDYLLQLLL